MTIDSLIKELDKLPLSEKLFVIERTLKSIRKRSDTNFTEAIGFMSEEYRSNAELTVFTQLDAEPFYETR